jgi:hypothetical protein
VPCGIGSRQQRVPSRRLGSKQVPGQAGDASAAAATARARPGGQSRHAGTGGIIVAFACARPHGHRGMALFFSFLSPRASRALVGGRCSCSALLCSALSARLPSSLRVSYPSRSLGDAEKRRRERQNLAGFVRNPFLVWTRTPARYNTGNHNVLTGSEPTDIHLRRCSPSFPPLLVRCSPGAEPDARQARCVHYRRKCKIRAPCCGEVFDCRHCHNEAKVRNSLRVIS